MYRFASDMGSSLSPIIAHELLGDVAADPDATELLLRVLNHDVSPADLFSAGRIVRAIGRAARRQPHRLPAIAAELGREASSEFRHLGRRLGSRLVTPPISRFRAS